MTTRDELIEAVFKSWNLPEADADSLARDMCYWAVDAILAKLSEDDPERVKQAQRAASGHGGYACISDRQMQAALDAAGPSVVIVKHAREPDPDTSGYLDGWKARAEKAEADRDEWKAIAEERTALKQELRDLQRTARQAEAHLSRHRYLEAHDLLRAALGE